MLCMQLPPRGTDAWGDGAYHSSRSRNGKEYLHDGFDRWVLPGGYINSPCVGEVTHLGWVYSDDPFWRYVEVTDLAGLRHQVHYLDPLCVKGDTVTILTAIGIAQDISTHYHHPRLSPMKPHLHYKIIGLDGKNLNPEHHHHV